MKAGAGSGDGVRVAEIAVADPSALWARLGFRVHGGIATVGTVPIRLDAGGRGLTGWTLAGIEAGALDGLCTAVAEDGAAMTAAGPHPNGVTRLDHVVAFSPDLDRTIAALTAAGLDLRRVRDEPTPAGAPRQAFFRLGETILEVIQQPPDRVRDPDGPARLWGLAFTVDAIEAPAAALGDLLGEPRPAVQPGRTIATLRREAGSTVPIAFMTPA